MAAKIARPVALKAAGPDILHKTEIGAVRLDLEGASDVEQAAEEMVGALSAAGQRLEGFVVQEMVEGGVEMLVGVVHDPLFGPVVACGAGGIRAELLRDVSVRVTPITDLDAAEMVRSLRTLPLLEGFRGAPPVDIGALEDMVLRIGALVDEHPALAEMDCNPVIVQRRGVVVVDARIRVQAVPVARPLASRAGAG